MGIFAFEKFSGVKAMGASFVRGEKRKDLSDISILVRLRYKQGTVNFRPEVLRDCIPALEKVLTRCRGIIKP